MKTTISFFVFICMVLGTLSSCNNESCLSDNEDNGTESSLWQQQLELIKSSSQKTISKSLFIKDSKLSLVNYNVLSKISTESDLQQLKEEILADNSYFPFYNVANNKIEIKTLKEIASQEKVEGITYSPERLGTFLNETLSLGMTKVELEWMCDSQIYKTICVVSDKNGIAYDNIISNTLCINEEEKINVQVKDNPTIMTKEPIVDPKAKTLEWILSEDCYWLSGQERGSVYIYHSITGFPNDLQACTYYTDHDMIVGNSDAQIKQLEYRPGNGGFSACVYGYYMATPGTNVYLTYNPNRGKFELSGAGLNFSMNDTGTTILRSEDIPSPDPDDGKQEPIEH